MSKEVVLDVRDDISRKKNYFSHVSHKSLY